MSALSNADSIRLAQLHDYVRTLTPNPIPAGRALADCLRRALPDLDDVTLGLVALELGADAGRRAGCTAVAALSDQLMCAALDLTATEWEVLAP